MARVDEYIQQRTHFAPCSLGLAHRQPFTLATCPVLTAPVLLIVLHALVALKGRPASLDRRCR